MDETFINWEAVKAESSALLPPIIEKIIVDLQQAAEKITTTLYKDQAIDLVYKKQWMLEELIKELEALV